MADVLTSRIRVEKAEKWAVFLESKSLALDGPHPQDPEYLAWLSNKMLDTTDADRDTHDLWLSPLDFEDTEAFDAETFSGHDRGGGRRAT